MNRPFDEKQGGFTASPPHVYCWRREYHCSQSCGLPPSDPVTSHLGPVIGIAEESKLRFYKNGRPRIDETERRRGPDSRAGEGGSGAHTQTSVLGFGHSLGKWTHKWFRKSSFVLYLKHFCKLEIVSKDIFKYNGTWRCDFGKGGQWRSQAPLAAAPHLPQSHDCSWKPRVSRSRRWPAVFGFPPGRGSTWGGHPVWCCPQENLMATVQKEVAAVPWTWQIPGRGCRGGGAHSRPHMHPQILLQARSSRTWCPPARPPCPCPLCPGIYSGCGDVPSWVSGVSGSTGISPMDQLLERNANQAEGQRKARFPLFLSFCFQIWNSVRRKTKTC